ncbi:hypothetical protein DDP54_09935 [Cellulomonas sp. WB94]|uniref:hypothetical protein n=1 Tax=Cellulomonas sp. WB94 TaxID=2173174 RepID=UPI000D569ACC|nr:hypothetical protein [Cellulomonas sp. WB94]PVU83259.1 hypothetical protein DDP54_09935 [Cellulomonas sp. WB94]
MAVQDNVIPEWRLNRTIDEHRDRAKRTMIIGAMIIGAGVVASILTYASSVRDLALPVAVVAVLAGGVVLMLGTRRWVTANVRAVRELSSPGA